ncbi:MAG TPA: hypothetical protein VN043_15795, partial [Rhodanobacter sp.]|nr:hypothetical protein [Rhodanobacter sp.]
MSIDTEVEMNSNAAPAVAEAPAIVLPVLPEVTASAPAAAPAKKPAAKKAAAKKAAPKKKAAAGK